MQLTPEQVKGRIKNVAKENKADARTLMRIYMMERFLERVANSQYKDNFIIKGGMLVTAMVGVALRSTMDIDTSIKNQNLSAEDARRIVDEIKDIDLGDGVTFEVKEVSNIMDEMGEIAKSVLDAGGTVTGVETTLFMQDDLQYDGLTELIVTETITERKTEMIRRGDAFIAFPGGTGTLEEIAEVMSKVSLKQLNAPCILYNLNGYYNGLKTLLDHMIETGLSTKERQEGIWFAENLEQIKQILKV